MKVKILRGFCLGAGRDVFPGDEIEMDDALAAHYIGRGKAEALPPPAAPAGETKGDAKAGAKK